MLSLLGHTAGSELVVTTSSTPLVAVHAVKQVNGKTHVLLINKDSSATRTVSVSLNGEHVHGLARVVSYGMDATSLESSLKRVHGSSFSITLAPYSMSTVQLP
jgi:hypothetical protein